MNSELEEFFGKTGVPGPPALLRLMIKTGLPREFLQSHLDYVETKAKDPAFDVETFCRTSPAYAAWVAQQSPARPLSWSERACRFLIEKWKTFKYEGLVSR